MFGNIAQFWRLTRELDINALRDSFERTVTIRVLGSSPEIAERVARLIEPDPAAGEVIAEVLGDHSPNRYHADLNIIALDASVDPQARRALSDLSVSETPLVLVQSAEAAGLLVLGVAEERVITLDPTEGDDEVRDRLFVILVRTAPEVMLSAGRRHPLLREPVADHLILDISRVNAQFAAISSLPSNVPILGGLVGDMADVLVLTKNQVLLMFKLGGLYGRDIDLSAQLLLEVIPVVGGAFLWRTTARALVGLLPNIVGIVPKTLIAYVGTYVVGQSARYYFRFGHKPPPEVMHALSEEGLRIAREAFSRLHLPGR